MLKKVKDTVSISLFNRGLAGKVFDEVNRTGAKVVMKNNAAECVLISPAEYTRLMDELNDARLLAIAAERMSSYDPATTISHVLPAGGKSFPYKESRISPSKEEGHPVTSM